MLISVMVPVYNVKQYLSQCIESILNQSYTDFELIVVDDGSTDGSSEICDNYTYDKRVKVIHKPNGGLVSARKEGLKHATGEYCCFVDSDDYIGVDYLKTFADAINRFSPDVTIIDCIRFNEKERFVLKNNCDEGLYIGKALDDLKSGLIYDGKLGGMNLGNITFSLWNKCFKRHITVRHYEKANEDIMLGEDMMISMPIIANAASVYVSKYNGYYYRKNSTSIVNTFRQTDFINTKTLIEILDTKMESHYNNISQYLFYSAYNTIVSAAKFTNSYSEFKSGISQLFNSNDIKRIKTISIDTFSLKEKIRYFLVLKRLYFFIWVYIKMLGI